MTQLSIFDLLQSVDAPQAQNLHKWLGNMFPKATDRSSIQIAIQLEKLFEMAVFENQTNTVHLLLQQGFSPDIRGDWGTTPLMWATCLNYSKIMALLTAYGANQQATSFSGLSAKDFRSSKNKAFPEYQAILKRKNEIHAQVVAGYLKPLDSSAATSDDPPPQKNRPSHLRQIDNGKGVDEVFKEIKTKEITQKARSRKQIA